MKPVPQLRVVANKKMNQSGLIALKAFKKGDVISPFSGKEILPEPNYLTVQLSGHEHIYLQPDWLQYINHSCDPNAFFNIETMQLECLKDVAEGEELTYFYPSTEWEMDQSFVCKCGSPDCIGVIRGAQFLEPEVAGRYRFSPFIRGRTEG